MVDKVLKRTMFETSRVLEYFTERELSYQTGLGWVVFCGVIVDH